MSDTVWEIKMPALAEDQMSGYTYFVSQSEALWVPDSLVQSILNRDLRLNGAHQVPVKIKTFKERFLEFVAENRQRLGYMASWAGLFGMPMLYVSVGQDLLAKIGFNVHFAVLYVALIVVLIALGTFCEKSGLINYEHAWTWKHQTAMKDDMKIKSR